MSDLITQDEDDDKIDPEIDNYLRSEKVVAAINSALPDQFKYPPIPKDYVFRKANRDAVGIAHHAAFDLIGGLPAFVHWAAKNPNEFYSQWSKVIGKGDEIAGAQAPTFVFQTSIPEKAIDFLTIDPQGRVSREGGDK